VPRMLSVRVVSHGQPENLCNHDFCLHSSQYFRHRVIYLDGCAEEDEASELPKSAGAIDIKKSAVPVEKGANGYGYDTVDVKIAVKKLLVRANMYGLSPSETVNMTLRPQRY